ncbi:arsenate reductase family protein [Dokdonia sp. R86516]|uniref:arsenate reductase family protein n=1 Tax=Dokdonia sp. R86516 TaxID=3093856 RepID=UPI0037C53C44
MPTDMTLATDNNELIVIYSSESSIGKQTLVYAKSSDAKLNLINISDAGLTGTQWSEVADLLGVSINELVSKDHPEVDNFVKDATMSDDHWIKFIQNNPNAIQNPILIQGTRAKQITTPSQAMQFIEVDSAGLEKHNVGESPEISSNTDNEHQVD